VLIQWKEDCYEGISSFWCKTRQKRREAVFGEVFAPMVYFEILSAP
jgi:hypothetical protein